MVLPRMLYPFLFRPVFQERIWGGRNLETLYGKQLPPKLKIGESWEISDREEAQSVILNGPLAGKTLHWLMQHHERDLLGTARCASGRFPLLVKILDAEDKLSLQVHPPAHKAAALGGEAKTELWYITHARPGAELYVGLKPGVTRASFEQGIREGSVAESFHRVPVKSGDAMFLPSGRVHAIGAGLVIFEIQQNSDTTYRVFDWNRVDASGQPRPLHVKESLECIDFSDIAPAAIHPSRFGVQKLVDDPLFAIEVHRTQQAVPRQLSLSTVGILAVIEGAARVGADENAVELTAGRFCLVPASLRSVQLTLGASTSILFAKPGSPP